MDSRSWIKQHHAAARETVVDLLREIGHAGLAANYLEHWQLSLDLNQSRDDRRLHVFAARLYAQEIGKVLECNNWHRLLDAFDPLQR